MQLTENQKRKVWVAMSKYDLYLQTKVSAFNQMDVEKVSEVRKELGMKTEVCKSCLDEIVNYIGELHKIYNNL